ncbi:MAG: hypothetical protein NUV97_00730 [archaeon]|nr:hypothetical protein [archaeon]MCR4323354.1 hypothetical protein [Nanoarchaeota archaeon]
MADEETSEKKPQREKRLILDGSPCDTNYFDRTLLTLAQARGRGREICPRYNECNTHPGPYCSLQSGLDIAKYVVQGQTLEKNVRDFSVAGDFLNDPFIYSVNRRDFPVAQGRARFVRAAEGFARVVLLMDPFESTTGDCDKCLGPKTKTSVIDSIHDGPFPLSGSGRTIQREVEYCADCEPTPCGGFLKEDPRDKAEREFLKRLRDSR